MTSLAVLNPPARRAVRVRRLTEHRVRPRPAARPLTSSPPSRRPTPPPSPAELRALMVAVLEVLDGRRPPSQLEPLLLPQDQRDLLRHARKPGAPRRRLCSLRPRQPSSEAIELCATVADGDGPRARVRALVGRLERHSDRWRFTLLRFV